MVNPEPRPPRTKNIIAKVTPDEHAEIHAAARSDGRDVSSLVRWLLTGWLKTRR